MNWESSVTIKYGGVGDVVLAAATIFIKKNQYFILFSVRSSKKFC